ncbi:MAG: DNA repair protein RadC [Spirochaetia bacterium]|jgi:DNA repair protein RadC|nr:DNA repair protein RadC [Spirochaetia bacterium]
MELLYCMEKAAKCPDGTPSYDMRERMLRDGPRSLSDRELLAVVLGTGCAGRSVSDLAMDVQGIIDRGKPDLDLILLEQLSGMGSAKVCAIGAAMELGRRYYAIRDSRIAMPKDVFPLISHFADRKQEYFICISLNGAHEVISARRVTQGLVNRTVVHPREIYADPITDRACAIVVAHNHPSGNIEPSKEDVDITNRLREAGDIVGIPLLDHIVFSASAYYSFVEHGLISPFKGE